MECVGSASAAAFNSAASESFTTPLTLSNCNNWSIPADPETLRRLLASEEVRMPFFTSRSSRVEFAVPATPGLAPLAGADAAFAPVAPVVVAELLLSAAHSAAGNNKQPTTARIAITNRKESLILASASESAQFGPGCAAWCHRDGFRRPPWNWPSAEIYGRGGCRQADVPHGIL